MSKKNEVSLLIAQLKINLYVRRTLDEDRVIELAQLIEHGIELDPIEVTPDNRVIDGRHRIEAHNLLNREAIRARVTVVADETDTIARAYRANTGGAKPPTQEDTEHTVTLLLSHGQTHRRIAELLGLPVSLTRKFIETIQSKAKRMKMQQALDAVANGGLSPLQAAQKHNLDVELVKGAISGRRKKTKDGFAGIQHSVTTLYRSASQKNRMVLESVLRRYEDADVTEKQVLQILAHMEKSHKSMGQRIQDWRARFEKTKAALKAAAQQAA